MDRAKMMTATHFLSTNKLQYTKNFLASPLIYDWKKALNDMSPIEKLFFEQVILLGDPQTWIPKIYQFKQKSPEWKWSRRGRITGSITAGMHIFKKNASFFQWISNIVFVGIVGHCKLKNERVMNCVKKALETPKEEKKQEPLLKPNNNPLYWGSGKEVYAARCYLNDFKRQVVQAFRKQRLEYYNKQLNNPDSTSMQMLYFTFRGQSIPLIKGIHADPHVELRNFAQLTETQRHWRACSPDGVLFVNGVAVGCLEIKCSVAKSKSLYVNFKSQYYEQLMHVLFICNSFWPSIKWIDLCNWTPRNFTSDTFFFDADYYFGW
jgi:hypothetical protein